MLPLQIRNINSANKLNAVKTFILQKILLLSSGPLIYSSPNITQPPTEKTKHKA